MARLFAAIDLPDDVKRHLLTLKTDIPMARWVQDRQMHLTLRFIGDNLSASVSSAIESALAGVEAAAFSLALRGVGRFPPADHKPARVLWAGVTSEPRLLMLHRQVEQALANIGFAPEDRPFHPHITLARLQAERPSPAVTAFISAHQTFHTQAFPVRAFALYSSILSPQGSSYRHEAVFPLRDPGK